MMRLTQRSFDALPLFIKTAMSTETNVEQKKEPDRKKCGVPASSSTLVVRYSRMAKVYMAAFAPMQKLFCVVAFRHLWIQSTEN
jgi:hypothetical protein